MVLKRLIIIRHSVADMEGFLTTEGKILIQKTTNWLRKGCYINSTTRIICSEELRAVESARLLMEIAGIKTELTLRRELFSDRNTCNTAMALKAILEYLESTETETLIVVTHFEMTRDLPDLFRTDVLKGETPFLDHKVGRGRGIVIDCEKKIRWSTPA